jgi:hypothetical protein
MATGKYLIGALQPVFGKGATRYIEKMDIKKMTKGDQRLKKCSDTVLLNGLPIMQRLILKNYP